MRLRNPITAFFLILLLACPLLAAAQPLANRLPADTLIYAGWRGSDSMGPGYEASHLKAVLDSSDFSQVINEFLPQVFQRIAQEDAEAREVLPVMAAIARPMWKHPAALYFGGLDLGGAEPMPRLAMLCEAGADAPQLLATLKDLIAKNKDPNVPVEVKKAGGLVVVTIGKMSPEFDASLGGGAAGQSLANDAGFKEALAQVNKDPSIAFYVNVEGILSTAEKIMEKEGNPEIKANWPKVRDALGLAGLKRIVYAGGFDGKDWLDTAFVAAPAPRTGLLKLGDGGPLAPDLLKVAPKTSTYVAAGRFDAAGLISQIREGIAQFDPNAGQQADAALGQVSQMLGLDVRKDLLGALGDQWVLYADPAIGGYGFAGTVLVNRMADAAKAEQSFTKLEQFLNQMIAAQLKDENPSMAISFQTRKAGDLTLHYLAVPLVTPTWAIKDGNLYVALYPQTVTGAADFVTRKGPSILESADFAAVSKRLGGQNASSIQFSDLSRLAPINYGTWLAVSRLIGFADLFGVKSPLMVMPPLDKLLAHLGPAGGVTWADDAGFHVKSVCPFPGSTILTTDPMSAYMSLAPAMSLGIMVPSLHRATATSNRVKSAANLRQIGQGCLLYSNENKGQLPPDLGTLLKTEDLTAEVFISPSKTGVLPPDVLTMTPDQQAAWVNEHADYVYLGKGRKVDQVKAEEPLAHEKFDVNGGQGINILYGDGHVEFLNMEDAQKLLAASAPK